MTSTLIAPARRFVMLAKIPDPPSPAALLRGRLKAARSGAPMRATLDTARNQAAVVGSDILAFVRGVPVARREAILHSSLLAQLVANSRVPDRSPVYDWYAEYFRVLAHVGWVVQQAGFTDYREQRTDFEAQEAVSQVAATLLGRGTAGLALATSVLEALKAMDQDSPWIAIFSRESQWRRTAHFQFSVAEQEPSGQLSVNLMAFGLEASAKVTRLLFFRVRANEATLKYCSGKVRINLHMLDDVREELQTKLAAHGSAFVRTLPDFAP